MRPAGGYTPDLINYANSVDCYQIWADMVCYDELRHEKLDLPHHYCVYAAAATATPTSTAMRRFWPGMPPDEDVRPRTGCAFAGHSKPDVCCTLDTATERDAFVRYVQEQAPAQAAKD